jgi:hypothetical protein
MRRVAIMLIASLFVGLSNGQPLAGQRTDDQKQAAREKAREERAQKKLEEGVVGQSNKPTPLMRFHVSRHSTPELSWLDEKKRKGYSVDSLFLGK